MSKTETIQEIDASSFHGDKSKIYSTDDKGRLVLAGEDAEVYIYIYIYANNVLPIC